jgi:ElaB/YqjD/DUF883 family membrane-anchored ribosome-binding protein
MTEQEQPSPRQQQAELRATIERTRRELGETVEALAQRADVMTQAKEKVEEIRTQARDNPVPVAVGVGAALVVLWLMRRR